ncbi:MbcA/ParS/Xre antitoxin family protein [Microvirga sp. c23x22]|uniref:DUF2384 domain-containing protein n=1 Tax=Microvirga terricola TaxID=2719797 RepID=A0ABX0VCX7_9HYPH|nr:DUF2384 domain-containing protein [Microvirga terricola]
MSDPRNIDEWQRIRSPGLNDFLELVERWTLSEDDQAQLLRCGSVDQLRRWIAINQTDGAIIFSSHQTARIAAVLRVAEAARHLFSSEQEERCWLSNPNTALPFLGRTPLSMLRNDSTESIWDVRRYLMGLIQGGPGPNEIDSDFIPYTDDDLRWT